jgi:hypothetical protein
VRIRERRPVVASEQGKVITGHPAVIVRESGRSSNPKR